jgi:hypothetical protein
MNDYAVQFWQKKSEPAFGSHLPGNIQIIEIIASKSAGW